MQKTTITDRLNRARELLQTMRHAALATVNPDGSPHNSPVFSTWDDHLNFYWASGQDTQHSKNIAHDPRVFIALYDSVGKGGGLYVQATAQPLQGNELAAALRIVNKNLTKWQRPQAEAAFYSGQNPQRIYKAICQNAWVNMTEYDAAGQVLREYRHPITWHDLLQ